MSRASSSFRASERRRIVSRVTATSSSPFNGEVSPTIVNVGDGSEGRGWMPVKVCRRAMASWTFTRSSRFTSVAHSSSRSQTLFGIERFVWPSYSEAFRNPRLHTGEPASLSDLRRRLAGYVAESRRDHHPMDRINQDSAHQNLRVLHSEGNRST
jgi:hypothetical protein